MCAQFNKTGSGRQGRRMRGFERTSGLVADRIKAAGEKRGFAVARLLTHWAEIVGEDTARIARPVKVGYGKGAFGATLSVLTTGAQAPMLEMQKETIRARVNAVYGYNAIARIHITQTAPTGFADGQASFAHAPKVTPEPDPEVREAAIRSAAPIGDEGLRHALEKLGENIFSRPKQS